MKETRTSNNSFFSIYLISIIPFIFILRLYQIYMNIGIEPYTVDALRELNFLWIVLALTAYPLFDFLKRTVKKLKSGTLRVKDIPWYYWFLVVSAVVADAQAVLLAHRGTVSIINVRFFLAYQLIGLCAFYLGVYKKNEMHSMIMVLVGIIALSAVYGLLEWVVYSHGQTQLLLIDYSNRVESLYGNAILSSSTFLVGYWLTSLIDNYYLKASIKGILLLAIVTTISRSTWIGLLFSFAVVIALGMNGKSDMWQRANKKLILGTAAAACIVVVTAVLSIPSAKDIILARFVNISTSGSYLLRIEYWRYGIEHFMHDTTLADKIAGTGYGSSESIILSSEVYEKWKETSPQCIHFDNVYISVLTDFGVSGILALLIIAWKAVTRLIDPDIRKKGLFCCSMAIISLLPAVAFWDPIYCPINMILFITLCGIVMSDNFSLPGNSE